MYPDAWPDLQDALAPLRLEDPLQVLRGLIPARHKQRPAQEMRHRGRMNVAQVAGQRCSAAGNREPCKRPAGSAMSKGDEAGDRRAQRRKPRPIVSSHQVMAANTRRRATAGRRPRACTLCGPAHARSPQEPCSAASLRRGPGGRPRKPPTRLRALRSALRVPVSSSPAPSGGQDAGVGNTRPRAR